MKFINVNFSLNCLNINRERVCLQVEKSDFSLDHSILCKLEHNLHSSTNCDISEYLIIMVSL